MIVSAVALFGSSAFAQNLNCGPFTLTTVSQVIGANLAINRYILRSNAANIQASTDMHSGFDSDGTSALIADSISMVIFGESVDGVPAPPPSTVTVKASLSEKNGILRVSTSGIVDGHAFGGTYPCSQ
jgi:hypothetical protein